MTRELPEAAPPFQTQRNTDESALRDAVAEAATAPFPVTGETAVPSGSVDEVAALRSELAALNDRLLRALAEQENIRRRLARESDDAVRHAASAVAFDLLPALDNLGRALNSVPADREGADPLLVGVAATEAALLDALKRHGIRRIEPAEGEAFDPHVHQAMMEVPDSGQPPGTVARLLQPGYVHHHRLLRPALVGVAR
jgi:molecular chaperone GrpE